MFKRIMVPLNGTSQAEQALPVAARIAKATGGTIVLWRVLSVPVGYAPYLTQNAAFFLRRDAEHELAAQQYLAALTQSATLAGIPTEIATFYGDPALTLIDAIAEHKIDLVIIYSHGRTGIKRWVLGSVAQTIAEQSSVPALILHEESTLPLASSADTARPPHTFGVTVALDGSQRSLTSLEPAAQLAAALAAPAQGVVHLTQVVPLPSQGEPDHEDSIDRAIREQVLSAIKKYMSRAAEELREGLAKDLNILVTWSIIIDSDVKDGLIAVTEKGEGSDGPHRTGGYDLLAITTHGQGGRWSRAMGNVTERVLSVTHLPLLVVRPHKTEPQPEQNEEVASSKA